MELRKDINTLTAKGVGSRDWYLGDLHAELKPKTNSPLPTNGDALKYYVFLNRTTRMHDKQEEVIKDVVVKVEVFWEIAGISTVLTSDRFASKPKRLLGSLIKQFDDLKKCKNKPKLFETKCIEFDALCAKLYDIAHPQAEENIQCCRFRNAERKIEDLDFLQDQRTTRLKGIGPVDKHFSTQVSNKQS